jgi:LmbE family N-acetylglucosaminyl deacetylase
MGINNKTILILCPHADDETLGCGGLIHKLSTTNNITIICFSYCDSEQLKEEFTTACHTIDKNLSLDILDFKVRYFDRQVILDKLIDIKNSLNPDIVMCPCSFDIHQDHIIIYNETLRAFKDRCILGYSLPWNIVGKRDFRLTVHLSEENIKAKNMAMDKYKTQYHREYFKDRTWIGNKEKIEIILWKY